MRSVVHKASFVIAVVAWSAAATAAVDDRQRVRDVINDVVAVAVVEGGRAVVLATPALPDDAGFRPVMHFASGTAFRPAKADAWRYRVLPLRADTPNIAAAAVSASGTKLIGLLQTGQPFVVDLTEQVHDVPTVLSVEQATHQLGKELLPIAQGDGVQAFDDHAQSHPDRIHVVDDCSNLEIRALVERSGTWWILVQRQRQGDIEVCSAPHAGASLPAAMEWLRASHSTPGKARTTEYSAEEVRRLTASLSEVEAWLTAHPIFRQHTPGIVGSWQIAIVDASPDLYAPALELALSERVFPTDYYVWWNIRANAEPRIDIANPTLSKDARDEALFRSYESLRADWDPGVFDHTVHYAIVSFPGTWLIEYWLYYPFDRGQGGHLHDSEHLFVEVDKLGGTVRQAIGAAHGQLSSNNIYRTDGPSVLPIRLPLKALVESGKHATSPDIDGDGIFTIGLDANVFRDKAKVWGIRDATAATDAHLRAYEGSMTSFHPVFLIPYDDQKFYSQESWFGGAMKVDTVLNYRLDEIDWRCPPTCMDKDKPVLRPVAMTQPPRWTPRVGVLVGPRKDQHETSTTVGVAFDVRRTQSSSGAPIRGLRLGIDSVWRRNDDFTGRITKYFLGGAASYEQPLFRGDSWLAANVSVGITRDPRPDHSGRYVAAGPLFQIPAEFLNIGIKPSFVWLEGKPTWAVSALGAVAWSTDCVDPAQEDCARRDIVDDPDAKRTFKALKASFAPGVLFPRFGIGQAPQSQPDGRVIQVAPIEIGGAVEFAEFLPDVLKFPGRVGALALLPGVSDVRGFTISYERLVTNLYGFNASMTRVGKPHDSGSAHLYLEFGPMFEFAPAPHLNMAAHLNLAYTNAYGITRDFKVLFSYVLDGGRFGLRRRDKSPYF